MNHRSVPVGPETRIAGAGLRAAIGLVRRQVAQKDVSTDVLRSRAVLGRQPAGEMQQVERVRADGALADPVRPVAPVMRIIDYSLLKLNMLKTSY